MHRADIGVCLEAVLCSGRIEFGRLRAKIAGVAAGDDDTYRG
jgi:hypothetical protein